MPSILILSAFFPPSLRIGSKRPARMAHFLARSGWDVTVLTMDEGSRANAAPSGVRVIRTGVWTPVDTLRRSGVFLARRLRGGSRSDAAAARVATASGSGSDTPTPGASPARAFSQWCARRMADLEFPDKYVCWVPRA